MNFDMLKTYVQYGNVSSGDYINDTLIPQLKLMNTEQLIEIKNITNQYYENNKFQKTNNYSYECAITVSLFYAGLKNGLKPRHV